MNEKQEWFDEDASDPQSSTSQCQCEECMKAKDRYVRIIDMDRLVDNLNDWD